MTTLRTSPYLGSLEIPFYYLCSALYLQDFADKVEIPFMEVSAKDATNVEQAFMTIVAQIRSKRYAHVP